jgi:hypothetical protein
MSQVDTVALWAGLISSIAGIVLSIVAMWFAIWVNDRSTEVNNQMIKSLQKIESSVERVSADTRELISAAWKKMLGDIGQDGEPEADDVGEPEQISGGIASELKSELTEGLSNSAGPRIESIERTLKDLQETLAAQLRDRTSTGRSESLDGLVRKVNGLPADAQALLLILVNGRHLDRSQYIAASQDSELGPAVQALRSAGLLVPLAGWNEESERIPVYYLAPGRQRRIKVAMQLTKDVPRDVVNRILEALGGIGYNPKPFNRV